MSIDVIFSIPNRKRFGIEKILRGGMKIWTRKSYGLLY
jgi:hypothetical protein